jgi:signal transduction histidine kinase
MAPAPATDGTVAVHRRAGRGRFWSVRVQLLAPVVVAIGGLAALGTVQTTGSVNAATDAGRAQVLASTATATVRLVHELERELAETAALRQRGGKSGAQLVTAQRQRADAAANRFRQAASAARRTAPALGGPLGAAIAELDKLANTTRVAAMLDNPPGSASEPLYRDLVTALLGVADALPSQLRDGDLATAAREIAAVAAVEHLAAVERDQVRALFSRGALRAGDLAALGSLDGARTQRESEFGRVADEPARRLYAQVVSGPDVDSARRMLAAVLNADLDQGAVHGDADAWYVAQSGAIRRLDLVGLRLSDRLDRAAARAATAARQRAWLTALGAAAVALLALLVALVLAVRISRRLHRLRAAALTVAHQELPAVVAAVTAGERPHLDPDPHTPSAAALTRRIAATDDEVGQVAEAFASVHRTALHLASEQAELHTDVARMAEVLARRIRTLVTRQLRLLDQFERDETDPELLARLFALDHLAARLRRNGENLLVLAGGEPGRSNAGAYPLSAVVAAAASEIEDFYRVEPAPSDVAVRGQVVGDLVHLLAELLENAATFSPPEEPVLVDARRTVDGLLLRVHDSGIGMTPARLAEVNERLARRATVSSAAAGTMGLYVVAHLAARHGIGVELLATGTGTVAYVNLPRALLAAPDEVTSTVEFAPVRTGRDPSTPQLRPYLRPSTRSVEAARPSATRPAARMITVPRPRAESPNGAATRVAGLPRRLPGSGLPGSDMAPAMHVPAGGPRPPARADLLDPELVRSRLSALSEGVAAAARRTSAPPGSPATHPARGTPDDRHS